MDVVNLSLSLSPPSLGKFQRVWSASEEACCRLGKRREPMYWALLSLQAWEHILC